MPGCGLGILYSGVHATRYRQLVRTLEYIVPRYDIRYSTLCLEYTLTATLARNSYASFNPSCHDIDYRLFMAHNADINILLYNMSTSSL